jgi:hypothetical protein
VERAESRLYDDGSMTSPHAFSRDELLALLVTPDDLRERSPAEVIAAMSEEDRMMIGEVAMALREFFARRRRISEG